MSRSLNRRLLDLLRPEWRRVSGLYLLSLAATPLALLTPLPLKLVVDSALGDEPLPGVLSGPLPGSGEPSSTAVLLLAAGMFVTVALLSQLQQLAGAALGADTGERLLLRLRSQLFRHVQRLSLRYHDSRGTADSTYRLQYDTMSIQWIVTSGLAPLLTSLLTVVAMIYVTALIDLQLVIVALAVSPVLLVVSHLYRKRLRGDWRYAKQLESSAQSVAQEVLSGLRVVKAFAQEEREHERFVRAAGAGMRARVKVAVVEGVFALIVGVVIAAGTATVLYVGARHVQNGTVTLGELLLVMGYLSQLYTPLQTIARTVGRLQAALASAERVFEVLDEAPDVPERPDALPLRRAQGRVSFENVRFGYGDEPLLEDVSFEVEPGGRVAVAGVTGAGKTTLISLLTRFYDPDGGTIRLDGTDLRDHRVADLRAQFAIVLQEPVLFSTTIRENIAYGRPDATLDEIVQAARMANIHESIARLPDGYETAVGERGMTLSGGERQRISIARAFLKDAPILVLDEPTSAVDIETELAIFEAIDRLMEGRTTFLISHRPSALERCSVRLQLERRGMRTQVGVAEAAAAADTLGHPAVAAWLATGEAAGEPSRVVTLKDRRRAQVYRLDGAMGPDRAIVAKRVRWTAAVHEHAVYTSILERLPLPTLHCHGLRRDEDPRRGWLFLDFCDGEPYRSVNVEHRHFAGRWFAALHEHCAGDRPEIALRDRTPGAYLRRLHTARDAMLGCLAGPRFEDADRRMLAELVDRFDHIEGEWGGIEALCALVPETVVHGDAKDNNLMIRHGAGGPELVPLDWGEAGWGCPAVDLPNVDFAQYARIWPWLSPAELRGLVRAGLIFRVIVIVDKVASVLDDPYVERSIRHLRQCRELLRT